MKLPHLARVDGDAARRTPRAIVSSSATALDGGTIALPVEPPGRFHIYNQFVVRVPQRDAVRALLDASMGSRLRSTIQCRFICRSASRRSDIARGDFPEAEAAAGVDARAADLRRADRGAAGSSRATTFAGALHGRSMTSRPRVVVTGAAGQLGSTVVARLSRSLRRRAVHARAARHRRRAGGRSSGRRRLRRDVVINCAAYNDVDGAEDAPAEALSGNALGVLCAGARGGGHRRATSSTTAPISCSTAQPIGRTRKTIPPRPLGIYGTSKLLGEWFALEAPGGLRASRREPVRGTSGQEQHRQDSRGESRERRAGPGLCRSDGDAELRRRTSRRRRRRCSSAALRLGLYHCVNTGVATWVEVAEEVGTVARVRGRRSFRREATR